MKITVIKNEAQYKKALARVDKLFDEKVKKGTPEGDILELLLVLIKDYEDKHYPVPVPDPIEALKLTMKEKGLKNKDLVPYFGSTSYISQILYKRKPLTAGLIRVLYKNFGIPAEILLA